MNQPVETDKEPDIFGRPAQPIPLWRAMLPASIFLLVCSLLIFSTAPRLSGNVWSRYMTMESIVERHTMAIDDSPWLGRSGTPDFVKFDGRSYSDKPPFLSILGAGIYWVLYQGGLTFLPNSLPMTNAILVIALTLLPAALGLMWLRLFLQWVELPPWVADLFVLVMGFTSLLFPYVLSFNNHAAAAGMIVGAYYCGWRCSAPSLTSPRLRFLAIGAGLLAGSAMVTDIPAGGLTVVCLSLFILAPWRRGSSNSRSTTIVAFVVGLSFPIGLHTLAQIQVTGTPLPVEMHPEGFEYEGSYWLTEEGQWQEKGARWQFCLEFLIGPQGWITVTPVMLIALVGVCLCVARRGVLRSIALMAGLTSVILITYYSWGTRRTDFSGQSFGTRHMLAISPMLLLFAAAVVARQRHVLVRLLFIICVLVSGIYSWHGIRSPGSPWCRIEQLVERPDGAELRILQTIVPVPSSYDR